MTTRIHTRNITLLLYLLVLIIALVQLTGCGGSKGDPTPTPTTPSAQDEVKTKLTASAWKIQSVTVDGVDKSDIYKGMTLTLSGTTYTAANGGANWPASGTWTFTAEDGTKIRRDDGTEMLVEVTATTLKLTFTWTKTTLGGRLESVKGQNVFTFTK